MSAHIVANEAAGQRLDQFLRRELPEHSRAFLQKLIEAGFENVKRFAPQKIAAQYAALYRELANAALL